LQSELVSLISTQLLIYCVTKSLIPVKRTKITYETVTSTLCIWGNVKSFQFMNSFVL